MITRRELFALPLLGRGWFDDDPLETRVAELEEDLEATRRVLGQTIGAVVELARIIDNNTAYFEYRLDELEARLMPPEEKTQV